MLPITHHKSFHIPHSLALVAAAVALVAALGWHADQRAAEQAAPTADAISAAGTPEDAPDSEPAGQCLPHGHCADSGRGTALFPLVLPDLFGH